MEFAYTSLTPVAPRSIIQTTTRTIRANFLCVNVAYTSAAAHSHPLPHAQPSKPRRPLFAQTYYAWMLLILQPLLTHARCSTLNHLNYDAHCSRKLIMRGFCLSFSRCLLTPVAPRSNIQTTTRTIRANLLCVDFAYTSAAACSRPLLHAQPCKPRRALFAQTYHARILLILQSLLAHARCSTLNHPNYDAHCSRKLIRLGVCLDFSRC